MKNLFNLKRPRASSVLPALVWLISWGALFYLDGYLNLANLALILVLGSTIASLWQSPTLSSLASLSAVAAFDWFFVEPRYTFAIHLEEDLLLLVALLCTSTLTSVLTSRLRRQSLRQAQRALQAQQHQILATQLQHAQDVQEQISVSRKLLLDWTKAPVTIWLEGDAPPAGNDSLHRAWQAAQSETGAIGPGTGRFEELGAVVIPLRAGVQRVGLIAFEAPSAEVSGSDLGLEEVLVYAACIADEIHRLQAAIRMRESQEKLQSQQLRTTLLAAISHDYRTPLATIASAASGLLEDADKLRANSTAQIILAEVDQLNRMTSNTLELARLDTLASPPNASWESVEELFGAALAAARRHYPSRRIDVVMPGHLPLLHCDPTLLIQLLDNLLENALIYSPPGSEVTLQASISEGGVQIEVMDHGPGIPSEWQERVLDPFVRAPSSSTSLQMSPDRSRRGMGLGLALCRAVARVHGARFWLENRAGGGTVACINFPKQAQPQAHPLEAGA